MKIKASTEVCMQDILNALAYPTGHKLSMSVAECYRLLEIVLRLNRHMKKDDIKRVVNSIIEEYYK